MEQMPFGLKLAIINRAIRKRMDEKASKMGLTSVQMRVLGAVSLLEAEGEAEIHQNDLERIEHVTHPAMTTMMQRLEHKGFIRCVPSQQDRRYKKITSTEKSAGMYKVIFQQDDEVLEELCRGFSDEQRQQLFTLIDRMLENVAE